MTWALLMLVSGCMRSEASVATVRAAAPDLHVIVVSVDGLLPETYLDPEARDLYVPTLRAMMAEGAHVRAMRSVLPTVTYPAHTTMVTGRSPAAHGIVTNQAFDPTGANDGGWRWYAEDIRTPTLWQLADEAGLETALVSWPVTVGARADSVVPEYWRAGTDEDQKLTRALSTPGLLEGAARRFPDLWQRLTPPDVQDSASIDIAIHLMGTKRPHLMLVHVWMVDEMQHRHGPWSPEAIAAIEELDRQLARLVAAARAERLWERTVLVVVSDHGFQPVAEELRPGVALRSAGLGARDGSWTAAVSANGGGAYVYIREESAASRRAVDAALAPLVGAGVRAVHDRTAIAELGGDPAAYVWLDAETGTTFGGDPDGELRRPAGGRGTHGYDPRRPEMAAAFLAWGAGVPRRAIPEGDLLDVAPQVARWLGLSLPAPEGRPLLDGP